MATHPAFPSVNVGYRQSEIEELPMDNENLEAYSTPVGQMDCLPNEAKLQSLCLPLYKAAIKGNWEKAKEIIEKDRSIIRASITEEKGTALHVAAGARHANFVEELVKMMEPDDLTLKNKLGNNAFCAAAATGSVDIAKILIRKNSSLPEQLGAEGKTPLYFAALFGHEKMAFYMYSQSTGENLFWEFLTCINNDLYGLASIMLKKHPEFAFQHTNGKTALHFLAQKPSAFERDHNRTLTRQICMRLIRCLALPILKICAELARDKLDRDPYFNTVLHLLAQKIPFAAHNPAKWLRQYWALKMLHYYPELVVELDGNNLKQALRNVLTGGHSASQGPRERVEPDGNQAHAIMKDLLVQVLGVGRQAFLQLSHLLLNAVESGNSKFVAQLIHDCPDLIWETNRNGWTIIHAAVKYRHASIYSLVHEIGMAKDVIVTYQDKERKDNMLHLAAQLAPAAQLNKLSGAAFQMQRELLWFEEVKSIMQPSHIDMKNSQGKTPQDVFTATHATLLKDGEKWMNETARSCTIVSTLIAGALFAAGISVSLGGNNYKDEGTFDDHMRKDSFRIFIISDAIAFFLSLTATLMFFSILTSRYAERDFLKSLPLKLMSGLILLLFSIIAMMVAFSSVFLLFMVVRTSSLSS